MNERIKEMQAAKEITAAEAKLLAAAIDGIECYIGEFEPEFGGFSDIDLGDISENTKKDRGVLASLIKKDLLQTSHDGMYELIYLTERSYEIVTGEKYED
jgi:hypothetical protein